MTALLAPNAVALSHLWESLILNRNSDGGHLTPLAFATVLRSLWPAVQGEVISRHGIDGADIIFEVDCWSEEDRTKYTLRAGWTELQQARIKIHRLMSVTDDRTANGRVEHDSAYVLVSSALLTIGDVQEIADMIADAIGRD